MKKPRNKAVDGPDDRVVSLSTHEEPAGAPKLSREEKVARRAYERFEMRGGGHGRDQEDWFAAERDLNGSGDE